MLILNDLAPIHWALGGAAIGAITVAMLAVGGKRLRISTGFESLCGLVLRGGYFRRPALVQSSPWRLAFLVGLVAGGLASALLGGGWQPTWALGMFDARIGWGPAGKLAWMFAGGVLIGVGTRLAGGCTSGHGIFGLSNFERSGLVSTVAFMLAGLATTNLIYRLVWVG